MNERNRAGEVQIAWQSLTAAMLAGASVHRVRDLSDARGTVGVPSTAGVYAFWWVGSRARLMQANRHIVLKGPGGISVDVHYHDWWPTDAPYPCLYAGKTTNLRRRFAQHLLRGTAGRAHQSPTENAKATPRTTSCQLRFGIEHVFPAEANPVGVIDEAVGFSWCDEFPDNAVAERFLLRTDSWDTSGLGSTLTRNVNGKSPCESSNGVTAADTGTVSSTINLPAIVSPLTNGHKKRCYAKVNGLAAVKAYCVKTEAPTAIMVEQRDVTLRASADTI